MIGLHKPLDTEEDLMKLDDLRGIAKTGIYRGSRTKCLKSEDMEFFHLMLDEKMNEEEVTNQLKYVSVVMVDSLGWKSGTHFILKESLNDDLFSSAVILMKKERVGSVWICDIEKRKGYCLIEIPHYDLVKKMLGVRISIDPKFFGTEKMVGFLEVLRKKVLIETCKWPSTTLVAMDRDIFRRVTNIHVQDGNGSTLVVPASDRVVEKDGAFDFDFPHYESVTHV